MVNISILDNQFKPDKLDEIVGIIDTKEYHFFAKCICICILVT